MTLRSQATAEPAPSRPTAVTIITQTRARSDQDDALLRWQRRISAAVTKCAGFIDQEIIPPTPPIQVDCVILQRFASN